MNVDMNNIIIRDKENCNACFKASGEPILTTVFCWELFFNVLGELLIKS